MKPIKWVVDDVMRSLMAGIEARAAAESRGVTDKRELDRIGMAAFDATSNVIPLRRVPTGGGA